MSVADRLREMLQARGVRWPAPIEHFEAIGSTSDALKERGRAGAPEWTVVLADRQTAGRGRQGHVWISPPGNLYLSVLLRPSLPLGATTVLPLATGLAVAQALEDQGLAARLKWPNDVLSEDRKLAGVLTEAASGPTGLEAVVLGIGVNVNLDPRDLPPELRESATSLAAETGRPGDPVAVAGAVLARLTLCYHALVREGAGPVLAEWRSRSVPWWGRAVEVRSAGQVVRGVARGLDERGALLLEGEDGAVAALLSGEVRELRLASPEVGGTGR